MQKSTNLQCLTGLLLLAACTRTLPEATLTVDPDMVTRVAVHLENTAAITAHAEYGDAGDPEADWAHSPDQSGSSLDFTVYLHAGATSGIRIVGTDERDRGISGPVQEIAIGNLPSGIPEFTSTIDVTLDGLGPFLLTSAMSADPTETAVTIHTVDGRPVWYWQPGDGVIPAVRYDAASGLLYGVVFDLPEAGYGYTFTVPIAGGDVVKHDLTWAHHDALLLDDGVTATLVSTFGEFEGEEIAGDAIVEIAADGTERTLWDAFDHLAPAENHAWNLTQFPDGQADWTHANGLDYDPVEGAYYLSLWGPEQIIKVDRATGNTVWVMGGPENEFDFGDDAGFGPQHAPEYEDGHLRLFDNRGAGGSRACDFVIDEPARTATLDWSFEPSDPSWALVLGDVTKRPDGSHLMSWGSAGNIFVTSADDALVGFLQMDKALAVGQVSELGSLP